MRNFPYILILALLISCGNDKPKIDPKIIIEANVSRSYDTLITSQDTSLHKAFDVKLSIINKSEEPVSFWIMTCSWDENFIINNDYISFLGWGCDSNYPRLKHLNSNSRFDLKAAVIKYDFTRYQPIKTTKFGLIFIDSAICTNIRDYDNIIGDKSKQDKIIWSNPIYLNEKR